MDVMIRRRMMMAEAGGTPIPPEPPTPILPYDAEIEYLTNSGIAYINIPITSYPTWVKEVSFARRNNPNNYTSICGCFTSTTLNIWLSNGYVIFNCRGIENTISKTIPLDTQCTARANGNTLWFSYGDSTHTGTAGSNSSSEKVYLFGDTSNRNGVYSIYYFKMWDGNNELILDLIPVRVGQVGYMYDRVSGQLFGNVGTGEFILGNDKNS